MKIGVIGLGKLGYPVALAIKDKGHEVLGYDILPVTLANVKQGLFTSKEVGVQELLDKGGNIAVAELEQIVAESDIIFLAIQTPHDPRYEGVTPIPEERADFDYAYLKHSVATISGVAELQQKRVTLAIISTVLPGTIDREIKPILSPLVDLCYNPFFIAMGTVIPDFLNPEFVLLGVESREAADKVIDFYATIHSKPVVEMPIIDAELAKVAYNTFIGMKIAFANTLMEICHKNKGNVDNVTNAIKLATDRLISPKYLTAGMGDGGGCHPRDNIAMSYLAKNLNLSHNLFEDIMKAREDQTKWLVDLIIETWEANPEKQIIILGSEFKPETDLETGSPSRLLSELLGKTHGHFIQPRGAKIIDGTAIYFIGCRHKQYKDIRFAPGSIVLDPFRYIEPQEGVKIISIGKNHE